MSITNPSAEVAKRWKRSDVLKYLKSKQDEMDLDDEDIKIIEKNKVAGQVFISLTEDKLLAPPYNLLGGPAGTIALLIKALNGEVQVPASLQEPETAEDFEKTCINELPHNPISTSEENSVGTHLPENDLPEATRINKQSHDLVNAEHDLQIAKAIEKTHDPISILKKLTLTCLRLPLGSSVIMMEINVLRKLFADEHPAQMHLSQLEAQLKASCVLSGRGASSVSPCEARCALVRLDVSLSPKAKQMPRKMKKTYRRKISKLTKMLAKKDVVKEEIEIAKNSVIAKGYHRINKHYEDYHEASTQLVKRNLSDDGNEVSLATKRARTTK
ncbi:9098_t:CDS:2 [Ambispora gerdemannii]|uniref:9098_t:CDS:1 n=1 Tax=Ambispora gerdemannii TaxID=144530 RepID=A0A9N9D2B3_9GLOM|nr:9098_t:CDS:2 [Ambispora gerdemannii]